MHETPIEEQRNDARQYIRQVERKEDTEAKSQASGVDPEFDPGSSLVDEMLEQADFRKMLDETLARAGLPKLADLDADRQRASARAMIAALAQGEQRSGAEDAPGPDPAEATAVAPGLLHGRRSRSGLNHRRLNRNLSRRSALAASSGVMFGSLMRRNS